MKRPHRDPQLIQDIRPTTNHYYQPELDSNKSNRYQPEPTYKKKKRFKFRYLLLFLVLLVLIPLLIILALDIKNFSAACEKLFGTSNVLSMFPTQRLSSTSDETVHILLAGYSADDPGHGGSTLTDSIMVLGINKKTNKSFMLNIPRDLYVEIPGYGSAKINEAYQDGERSGFNEPGYPSGGMGLLTQVAENVTGLDINYYFLANYAAVKETVNALGGITVSINNADTKGIYDPGFKPENEGPLKLPNGKSNINGQIALNLTRARGLAAGSYGFPQSDFNRAENQQAVMVGVLKELSWKTVLNPYENKAIFDSVANNVKTNLQLSELIPMFRILIKLNLDSIKNYTLRDLDGVNYITSYTTPTGQSALIPLAGIYDYTDIKNAVQQAEIKLVK